jgi:hypothetical protein
MGGAKNSEEVMSLVSVPPLAGTGETPLPIPHGTNQGDFPAVSNLKHAMMDRDEVVSAAESLLGLNRSFL